MANLTGATIQNVVACDLYVTTDTTTDYFTNPPTEWDDDTTLLWARFDGDLNAGNISEAISYLLRSLYQVKIKRRILNTQEWETIRVYNVDNNLRNLIFSFNDNTNVNNVTYEYAWVPVLYNGTEGDYVTTTVYSQFKGVFLGDTDSMYKFVADISFGATERHQSMGIFEPIGRKYPIYVSNSAINYETGSFKGKIVGDYLDTNVLNRQQINILAKNILKFLTNKRAKILKDSYSDEAWLIMITDNPSQDYINEIARGLRDLNFNWSEAGDIDDLESVGLVKIV